MKFQYRQIQGFITSMPQTWFIAVSHRGYKNKKARVNNKLWLLNSPKCSLREEDRDISQSIMSLNISSSLIKSKNIVIFRLKSSCKLKFSSQLACLLMDIAFKKILQLGFGRRLQNNSKFVLSIFFKIRLKSSC